MDAKELQTIEEMRRVNSIGGVYEVVNLIIDHIDSHSARLAALEQRQPAATVEKPLWVDGQWFRLRSVPNGYQWAIIDDAPVFRWGSDGEVKKHLSIYNDRTLFEQDIRSGELVPVEPPDELHKPLNLPADRSHMIAKAVNGPDIGQVKKCIRPLGCDCPRCLEDYGPIHPGNVGKNLHTPPAKVAGCYEHPNPCALPPIGKNSYRPFEPPAAPSPATGDGLEEKARAAWQNWDWEHKNAMQLVGDFARSHAASETARADAAEKQVRELSNAAYPFDADFFGALVRLEWVEWAKQQPSPKPHWLIPWDQLDEANKEVDRRIGVRVAEVAASILVRQNEDLRQQLAAAEQKLAEAVKAERVKVLNEADFAWKKYEFRLWLDNALSAAKSALATKEGQQG